MLKPAHYFPPSKGSYEIKAGLARLNRDFGNPQDNLVFQIDDQWEHYFREKQASRSENLEKYYLTAEFDEDARFALTTYIMNQLGREHPEHFKVFKEKDGSFTLECHLNNATASFNHDYELIGFNPGDIRIERDYQDLFDFVCSHIQEDVSCIRVDGQHDSVTALHLCLPNHWAAQDKIGKCFAGAHIPVPAMEKINTSMDTLSQQLMHKGPFTRFAWGLATDTRLNHHPEAPPGIDVTSWKGRQFQPQSPELYMRVERQCIVGLPKVSSYAFFIRTYLEDISALSVDEQKNLRSAIAGMTEEVLRYKGLAQSCDGMIAWLNQLISDN